MAAPKMYPPAQPRDWKYWSMAFLTLFCFGVLAYVMLKSVNTPSVNQWWKTRSRLETTKPIPEVPIHAGTLPPPHLSIPISKDGDYYKAGFDLLAGFPSEIPDMALPGAEANPKAPKRHSPVPETIRALDGQKVSVVGFMIPMAMDAKYNVSSFILAESRMTCCYGKTPMLNQWIFVH